MVTIELLKAKGYPISILKQPEAVVLAEKTIKIAYFPKDADFTDEAIEDTLCALVFALVLRRTAMATRFGTVQKIDGYSQTVEDEKAMREAKSYAIPFYTDYLNSLEAPFDFNDIIGLYDTIIL